MLWQAWCPACKSHKIRRSNTQNAGELLLSLILPRWRCQRCDSRFFKFRWVTP